MIPSSSLSLPSLPSSSSSATVRVEKATSDLLLGPDWTLNMDICDSVNSDHWQAKDVIKAVKKRLQHKNPKVQFLALTLLETMMKNCGDYVHFQVIERDILQEMIKIVKKKTDMQVRDKILVLLDSWQEAFGGPGGKYPQYYWAYAELKRSGVEFPQRSPDVAPIFTPPINHPTPLARLSQPAYGVPVTSTVTLDEAMASEMASLSLSDLDRVRSVMELLSEMLKAVNPSDRGAVKDEVITDLVSQCRSNQKKLMQLVNTTMDEEHLEQVLQLNDDLQSLLAKHDAIASGSPLPTEIPRPTSSPSTPVAPAPAPAPGSPMPNRSKDEEEEEEDENDEFAQLARRNSKYKQASTESTSARVGVQSSSENYAGATSSTAPITSTAASSSGEMKVLAVPDSLAPVKTATKEQEVIDLLAVALSSNASPPHTSPAPPAYSEQNRQLESGSPIVGVRPYNSQTFATNQGYVPYNTYVAPWAQPRPQIPPPQPQPHHQPPTYLQSQSQIPPPQPQPQHHPRPQVQPQSQIPQPLPQPQHQPQPQPQPQPQLQTPPQHQLQHQHQPQPQPQPQPYPQSQPHVSYNLSPYPPPPWADAPANPVPNPFVQPTYQHPMQSSRPLQPFNSFGPRPRGTLATGEAQINVNPRQPGSTASPKPYYLSNRLFEDLIELRNADGSLKTSRTPGMPASSNQSINSDRK
ncbi:TOM1-like protein 2 [Ananas comosus]|uniref:TOM1-like protein 2 n=1 Tax=Ananas comosus TaxID=4615 RepID=A0A199UQ19_ANACO|nr:TOM1-like protein 2 [Ananas comosus]